MNSFLLTANLALWVVVLFLAFLLLGALRAVALLRWRVDQLEAITPSRVGRSGLRPGKKAPMSTLPRIEGDTAGGEVGPEHYAGRELLLVFIQPGCGPCHGITPGLNWRTSLKRACNRLPRSCGNRSTRSRSQPRRRRTCA